MKKRKFFECLCGALVVISLFIAVSCSNNSDNEVIPSCVSRGGNINNADLLSDLQVINDSIKSKNEIALEPQAWGWLIKIFRVVESDVKGAIFGAQIGMMVNFVVAGIGAIVGGALFSTGTYLQNSAPALTSIEIDRTRYELLCQYVLSDKELLQKTVDEYDDVVLDFGTQYDNLMIIGAAHNACLKLYIGDKNIYYPKDNDDDDVKKCIQLLNSPLYNRFFDDFVTYSSLILSNNLSNSYVYFKTIQDTSNISCYQIIDLFNEGLEYCSNMEDVNRLVNSYFKGIEDNGELLDEEKTCLYSGLITGAYSASFWFRNSGSISDDVVK